MLKKKMLRDIRKNLSQFVTIFLMIMIGVMAYSGIEAYMDGMTKTADKFYSENNLSIELPNSAEISAIFNEEVSGAVTIDQGELEINPPSFNTEKSADIGGGAMLFMGFGGEGVLKNDE